MIRLALVALLLLPGCADFSWPAKANAQVRSSYSMGDSGGGGRRRRRTAGDPTAPNSPLHWFAAWKETTYSNTDPVGTATDFGSAGNDATQATAAAKPTFTTSCVGSRPCFDMDGGDVLQSTWSGGLTAPSLICIVFDPDDNTETATRWVHNDVPAWAIYDRGANPFVTLFAGVNGPEDTFTADSYSWACGYTETGTSDAMYFNSATASATSTAGDNQPDSLAIGCHTNGTTGCALGSIAEVIVWDSTGTLPALADVSSYLDEVYGSGWPK